MDPAVFAGELGATEVAADFEDAAVGEGAGVGVFRVNVEVRVFGELATALDFYGTGVFEFERPEGDVHVVTDPVEELAAAGAVVPAPVPWVDHGVVGEILDGAAPGIPVEVCRRFPDEVRPFFLGNRVLDAHSGGGAAFEAGEFAERVVLDECVEAAELAGRALPGAGLPDAFVFGDGIHEEAAFGEAPSEGFFAVDIESGVGGVDADFRVPVIWSCEADDVEAGVCEEVGVCGVGLAVGIFVMVVHLLFGSGHFAGVHVTDGDDADAGDAEEIGEIGGSHVATADDADGDFVVGGTLLGAEKCHGGEAECGGAGGEEAAAWDRACLQIHGFYEHLGRSESCGLFQITAKKRPDLSWRG